MWLVHLKRFEAIVCKKSFIKASSSTSRPSSTSTTKPATPSETKLARKALLNTRKARVSFKADPSTLHPKYRVTDSLYLHHSRLLSKSVHNSKAKKSAHRSGPDWYSHQLGKAQKLRAKWTAERRDKLNKLTSFTKIEERIKKQGKHNGEWERWGDVVDRYEAAYPWINLATEKRVGDGGEDGERGRWDTEVDETEDAMRREFVEEEVNIFEDVHLLLVPFHFKTNNRPESWALACIDIAQGLVTVFDPILEDDVEYSRRQATLIQRVIAMLRFEHKARQLPDENFHFGQKCPQNPPLPSRTPTPEDSGVYVTHFIIELARGKIPIPPTVKITGFDMQTLRSRIVATISRARHTDASPQPTLFSTRTEDPESLSDNEDAPDDLSSTPSSLESLPRSTLSSSHARAPTSPFNNDAAKKDPIAADPSSLEDTLPSLHLLKASPKRSFAPVDETISDEKLLSVLKISGSNAPEARIIQGPDRSGQLLGRDIAALLNPTAMVNDEVINCFIGVLTRESRGEVLFLTTHLWPPIRDKNYEQASRILKPKSIQDTRRVVLPIHFDGLQHWVFLDIDLTDCVILYYDTLLQPDSDAEIKSSKAHTRATEVCESFISFLSSQDQEADSKLWDIVVVDDFYTQRDTTSCGLLVALGMDEICKGNIPRSSSGWTFPHPDLSAYRTDMLLRIARSSSIRTQEPEASDQLPINQQVPEPEVGEDTIQLQNQSDRQDINSYQQEDQPGDQETKLHPTVPPKQARPQTNPISKATRCIVEACEWSRPISLQCTNRMCKKHCLAAPGACRVHRARSTNSTAELEPTPATATTRLPPTPSTATTKLPPRTRAISSKAAKHIGPEGHWNIDGLK
ncbi:hypothetical protein FRB90_012390 [Tulasnella sp. 427]|nr:hypothetical protein FRB90_012390 [Tulasnella sp. 427]